MIIKRKLFAKRDYVGLTKEAANYLKGRRTALAKAVKEERSISKYIKDLPEHARNAQSRFLLNSSKPVIKNNAKLYDNYVRKNKGKRPLKSASQYLSEL